MPLYTCRPEQSATMPVFSLIGPKMGFSPRMGDEVAPMNVKFGMESGPPCQILRSSGQKCRKAAQKLSEFRILAINLCLRGDSFAVFSSASLYVSKRGAY